MRAASADTVSRRTALVHALLFVLGFSLIFIALGATASVLGRVLFVARVWIARVGGALIILFGFYLLGAFNVRRVLLDTANEAIDTKPDTPLTADEVGPPRSARPPKACGPWSSSMRPSAARREPAR